VFGSCALHRADHRCAAPSCSRTARMRSDGALDAASSGVGTPVGLNQRARFSYTVRSRRFAALTPRPPLPIRPIRGEGEEKGTTPRFCASICRSFDLLSIPLPWPLAFASVAPIASHQASIFASRASDLASRASDLASRAPDLASRASDLASPASSRATHVGRAFGVVVVEADGVRSVGGGGRRS